MARWERRLWEGDPSGMSKADRASGAFETYIPDPVMGRIVPLATDTARLLAEADLAVAGIGWGDRSAHPGDLAGLLLRTEAAASSWIEGIPPRARQVAFAALAQDEDDLKRPGEAARLVANNIHIMRTAVAEMAGVGALTVKQLVGLQEDLVLDHRAHGLRRTQNWVGGSPYHPLGAAFVPPPPEIVQPLLEDLAAYLNDVSSPPLVQAGLAHAQFETIHAFPDGNGRVGRAVIHTVLARRGLTRGAVLPVSLVLMTRQDEYIAGLTAYRHVGPRDGAEAAMAANAWLKVFLRAIIDAVEQAQVFAAEVEMLTATWRTRLQRHRLEAGKAENPRSDSATAKLLAGLTQAPVMTNRTAKRVFGVSEPAASAAFAELTAAGITAKTRDRHTVVHHVPELLVLLDVNDRRLASPAFDTAVAQPNRPTPNRGRQELTMDEDAVLSGRSPVWSDRARSVWGKTDRDGSGAMSLVRHLEDAAGVAGELWDHWLPPNIKRIIGAGLPGGESDGRLLLTWTAGLHDIGKATPGFALKATYTLGNEHLLADMADHGLTCPPHIKGGSPLPPHCHLGQYVLSTWLTEHFGCGSHAADALTSPVGMHHGSPPDALELQSFRGSRWTGQRSEDWRNVQGEIIDGMTERTGIRGRLPDLVDHPPSDAAQVLLTAAVVVADWLASDTSRFRPGDPRPLTERLEEAGLEEALRSPWQPPEPIATAVDLLKARFPRLSGHGIHPMQQQVHAAAAAMTEPGLLVVEAPMGSGKTEAALMAAEVLARKFGSGGVFVALPTMATSDAMFARVLDWTRHAGSPDAPTMYLAHGKARLNEDYLGLLRHSAIRGINDSEETDGRTQRAEQATVSSWLQGRRKGVLANLVVGTIDQVLFGALKSRHVALRHLGLAGKVVIIDEVHAADTYMRRYLVRALEWLSAYGSPVILLSATLPPDQLTELTAAYARGGGVPRPRQAAATAYPRLTIQTQEQLRAHVPWTGETTEVRLVPVESDLAALVERLRADVEAGGCVVVIRNTVRTAQETYAALRDSLGAGRVALLHSQFAANDRAVKERELLSLLGPPGPGVDRPRGFVVIGTQVLEQSLDIDADVMESDHAPVDLLLQRMGRLHRHQRGAGQSDRPAALRQATLRVMGVPLVTGESELDRGSEAVYGTWPLLASAAVLSPHMGGEPVRLPEDIAPLVEAAYDSELPAPLGWEEAWAAADDKQFEKDTRSRERARTYRLAAPGGRPTLVGWLDGRAGDSEEATGGQARVRDTEDSLEILLVWQDESGQVRLLPGAHDYSGASLGVTQSSAPADHLALSVLASSVRLPQRITSHGRIDAVIRELEVVGWQFMGWQESPWLAGQLIAVLDANLRTTLGGQSLRYDSELGLVVEVDRD